MADGDEDPGAWRRFRDRHLREGKGAGRSPPARPRVAHGLTSSDRSYSAVASGWATRGPPGGRAALGGRDGPGTSPRESRGTRTGPRPRPHPGSRVLRPGRAPTARLRGHSGRALRDPRVRAPTHSGPPRAGPGNPGLTASGDPGARDTAPPPTRRKSRGPDPGRPRAPAAAGSASNRHPGVLIG